MTYKLPDSAREYVLYQRTELLPKWNAGWLKIKLLRLGFMKDNYRDFVRSVAEQDGHNIDEQYFSIMKNKADSIVEFIPNSVSSVLDIGCGIAALDLFLFERLNIRDIFLLDKTDMESQIWYMFEQKGAFYNSLDLAKETLTINGVDPSIVKLIEAPSNGEIPLEEKSIDLVLSTISWGFHYPVSTYIDSVAKILSDDGVLIIDVRKGTDGVAELQNHFKVSVIEEIGKIQTVKCTKEIA